jgi:hypothetical protein
MSPAGGGGAMAVLLFSAMALLAMGFSMLSGRTTPVRSFVLVSRDERPG